MDQRSDFLPIKNAAPGTPYFHVPVRYWETQEPETGHIVAHGAIGSAAHAADPEHVYGFHDSYKHTVYLRSSDTFLTYQEAVDEAYRRKEIFEMEREAEFAELLKRIGLRK